MVGGVYNPNAVPTTAADKAAALTYLKSNYDFPKSITFEDGEVYTLSFVTNSFSGTVHMNVSQTSGTHYATAYLDVMAMAYMSDVERSEFISKAAENAVLECIQEKKKVIASKMNTIMTGDVVEVNGVKHTVLSANNQELDVQASKYDKIKMWKGQDSTATQQQASSKGAFAGLLGALGALGSGATGIMSAIPGGLEAQAILSTLTKPIFVCPKCKKTWPGAAPQKCTSCGGLLVSKTKLEIAEDTAEQISQQQKANDFYSKQALKNLKEQTGFNKYTFGSDPGYGDEQDYIDNEDKEEVLSPMSKPKVPSSVKDAMTKPVVDDGFKDTSNDDQKFLQRIGVMSNLNVSVQGRAMAFPREKIYRLFCERCKGAQAIPASVVTQRRHEDKVLVEFCNTHRHISIVPQTEGERKFKDV